MFLWLSKILYGILYKEGLLHADRADPQKGRIVPTSFLKHLQMHHWLLQASRVPIQFHNFFPASIFVYRLQRSAHPHYQFNFRDLPAALCVSVQLGSVGILAALQDGGSQKSGFGHYLDKFHRYPLHPLQFLELTAKFFYKATLFNRVPKYIIIESKAPALQVVQAPLQGFSLKPQYDDWDQFTYAQVLSFHTGVGASQLYRAPDQVVSWLYDDAQRLRFLDIKNHPWPAQ